MIKKLHFIVFGILILTMTSPVWCFHYIESIGGFGSSKGLFKSPMAMTGDNRYLYIADTGNNRIIKLNPILKTVDQFSALPDTTVSLDHPAGILLYQGIWIVVADTNNHRLVFFSDQGIYQSQFGELGIDAGCFDEPRGLNQTMDGDLFIADSGNNRLVQIDKKWMMEIRFHPIPNNAAVLITDLLLDHPVQSASLRQSNDWVISRAAQLMVFDRSGQFKQWIPTSDISLNNPQGIAVDELDHIYVADTNNHRVVYCDSNGKILGIMTMPLESPVSVFPIGKRVYVLDRSLHQIVVFEKDGTD